MRSLCSRAETICTKGANDDKVRRTIVQRHDQYRRILGILRKLSEEMKRDKSQDDDGNDVRSLEHLAAKVA